MGHLARWVEVLVVDRKRLVGVDVPSRGTGDRRKQGGIRQAVVERTVLAVEHVAVTTGRPRVATGVQLVEVRVALTLELRDRVLIGVRIEVAEDQQIVACSPRRVGGEPLPEDRRRRRPREVAVALEVGVIDIGPGPVPGDAVRRIARIRNVEAVGAL